jgi:ubiquinone/menaquinone biosynthesis C-methylase UbiE
MQDSDAEKLKAEVREFWNQQSCDTQVTAQRRFSREYFEEIESFRYLDQPFVHSFAQFARYHGKKVLEVGFGAGTDFVQWLRAGALASGVDLTQEALDNVRHRIKAYELPPPERIQVADAEHLPFEPNTFDLGYSFGVLMLAPDTERAIKELVRVVVPGGEIKIMLYNRHSVYAFNVWVKQALARGKPWKSLRWALWNHVESLGTKGYTRRELRQMLSQLPLREVRVRTELPAGEYMCASAFKPLNWLYRVAIRMAGYRPAYPVTGYNRALVERHKPREGVIEFSGNPLGFFHCISARKTNDRQ